jgi:hypothetical protein
MKMLIGCKALLGAAAFTALLAFSSPAFAEVALGFDLDYAAPIKVDAVKSGYGFGIRLGNQIHVPLVAITPELGFTYHGFTGDYGPKVYRGIAGLRLAVGEVIRPGVFAHAGYGARKVEFAGQADTSSSFTYDFGAFLDFTLLPFLNLGVHAAYNQWTGGDKTSFQYATVGAHAALIF